MFDVPDQIEWPRLADALNKRWVLSNGRELTPDCVAYLGTKLFPGKNPPVITTAYLLSFYSMKGRKIHYPLFYLFAFVFGFCESTLPSISEVII